MAKKITTAITEAPQVEKSFEEQTAELNKMFGIESILEIKDRTLGEIFTKWREKNPKITPILNREQLAVMVTFFRKNKNTLVNKNTNEAEFKVALDLIDDIYKVFEVSEEDQDLSVGEIMSVFNFLMPQVQKSFRS